MKKTISIIILLVILIGSYSCKKDNNPEPIKARTTILIYMQSLNSLKNSAWVDIQNINAAYRPNDGNNVLVFIDSEETNLNSDLKIKNQLYLITGDGRMIPIEGFEEEFHYTKKDPGKVETLADVLNLCAEKFPAEKYGLVMSSHGSGWTPKAEVKSIGGNDVTKSEMNIPDLAAAIPFPLEFILFDACLMNNIEVVYELKDVTNYIIAATLQIHSSIFCYDIILHHLLSGSYKSLIIKAVNESKSYGRDIGMAVTDTKHLADVAKSFKKLITEYPTKLTKYDENDFYNGLTQPSFVDFNKFTQVYFGLGIDKNLDLSKAILAKEAWFDKDPMEVKIRDFSGYTLWLPEVTNSDNDKYLEYYKTYKWVKETGSDICITKLLSLPR